jgi:hypothetical protein
MLPHILLLPAAMTPLSFTFSGPGTRRLVPTTVHAHSINTYVSNAGVLFFPAIS